ncbi:hypothetical protein, conserved [Trypanosoma brucei gambiense DAL972]|uniref:TPM domain-containing protein n=1 Tax=Trypanosoma brucei gambiense (strain MHOM/CI/86/DAL972) TaxID=679716 RepID=C9ZK83_TRYB9|nr:hypothetical protein, conserved [Trypanosoma brucei gambiense DAL972]CBH09847.1 hypothetical protein, conserved [Trypanosoma brucei gambiense DAL972]|eukprot:XP_011772140.1 hypothetical protein, conserved [Trypanosoma brucei gambiense DAL972]
MFRPVLLMAQRSAGVNLLSPLAKLGQSRDLAADIKAGRHRNNKEVIASFEKIQTFDEIHYRKSNRPWELVPRYAKKRVSDLCGLLSSEDRMEIEQAIDKMQSLCEVDMYVVLVPTVGYTTPRAFANSILFDWGIGEPRGNGLLLLIAQSEASVQLVTSPAIEEYFAEHFLQAAVKEIFQPLVREGKASYAVVQLVYAIARQAQEMHTLWNRGFLALPTRNKVRFAAKTAAYGVTSVPYLLIGIIFFGLCSTVLVNQIIDTMCPTCYGSMHRVRDDATLQSIMTRGQYLEFSNGCAHYRVWKCPRCTDSSRVTLTSRDLHQSTRCLQCMDCNYYTCTLTKEVQKLPTKEEDGLKQLLYTCENCRIGREVLLPLLRPIDTTSETNWYDFLIDRASTHKKTGIKL